MNLDENIARFRQLEEVISESDRRGEEARWEQSRRAFEACVEGPMSQRAYAGAVGKDQKHIGRLCHVWQKWGREESAPHELTFTDAYRMAETGADTVEASVLAKRDRLPKKAEKRAEALAEALLADKDIAGEAIRQAIAKPSPASRRIEAVVAERERDRRQRSAERRQASLEREALPLPALIAGIVVKVDEWARELAAVYEDLDQILDDPRADLVAEAAGRLEEEAAKWRKKLTRSHLTLIEGEVVDVR